MIHMKLLSDILLLMLSPLYLSEGKREWEDSYALGIKNDENTALEL